MAYLGVPVDKRKALPSDGGPTLESILGSTLGFQAETAGAQLASALLAA